MGDWNLFFATTAGSSATLVGLLFVATQLHLGVFSDPKNRWAALAQGTLTPQGEITDPLLADRTGAVTGAPLN